MVVPYCYQCAPSPQPAILTIANAYTARMTGGMQKGAEEKQKSGKQKAERGGQGEKLKG
jgi:hypothetical protein